MSFLDVLYTLAIWPARFIIEPLFVLFNRLFYNAGFAIIFLSIAVNAMLLPIYTVADRWQHEERGKQKRMKKKPDDIKAVFKGDERQMIINTYYRQQGYSPLSALKSSVGLVLQVPFFLAAYWFLSHTPSIAGESFYFLRNLGEADGLLKIGAFSVNIMPILMTAINLGSALVYTKDLGARDKVQLYGISLIFLVLLYQSPSGLVLYWTCNNIFSLGKNVACAKLKRPGRALQLLTSLAALVLIGGAVSGKFDIDRYRFLFAGLGFALLLAPFAWKVVVRLAERCPLGQKDARLLYFSAAALLALTLGLLIPSQTIGGSVSDFDRPFRFLLRTLVQSLSLCLLIPGLVWAFSGEQVRKILSFAAAFLTLSALICLFALSASYGIMTNSFKIEDTSLIVNAFPLWVNVAAVLAALVVPAIFFFIRRQKILCGVYNATALALLVMCVINIAGMARETNALAAQKASAALAAETGTATDGTVTGAEADSAEKPVFHFTKTGGNTFIMFLDRATGISLYTALQEMPDLKSRFDGFTFYPNTISFGLCTVTGLPPMIGGYDYTPTAINDRDGLLKDKVNESLTMLPKLFGEAGYRVTITDPAMTNLQLTPDISVFSGMKNVTAENLDNRYNKRFMEEFPQKSEKLTDSFDFDILFRYGIFRIAPPAIRYGLHYKGTWWRDAASNAYGRALTEYSTLYYLGDICAVDDGPDTLSIFMNETTHEPGAYTKDLRPVPGVIKFSDEEIAKFGSEDNCAYLYTFMTAMKAVCRWLDALKTLGVYDNTRIIIVADHGSNYKNDFFETNEANMSAFNPLFMVKEPNSRGDLVISDEFMTNADTVPIAARALGTPVNPYQGTRLSEEPKNRPLTVVNVVSSQPRRHGPEKFAITATRRLIGRDIFKAASWEDRIPYTQTAQEPVKAGAGDSEGGPSK
jgi:YidC/Oxa1 family membrane protein insertase